MSPTHSIYYLTVRMSYITTWCLRLLDFVGFLSIPAASVGDARMNPEVLIPNVGQNRNPPKLRKTPVVGQQRRGRKLWQSGTIAVRSLIMWTPTNKALTIVLLLGMPATFSDALCVCGQLTKKAFVLDDYSSFYTIVQNVGCEDQQLATECEAVRYELDEFIHATMEHLDDTYVRFMTSLLTSAVARGNVSVADALVLREILENQRISALDALTDRVHPHCAEGLFTTTLYNDTYVRYEFKDWKDWDLSEIRNQVICYSPTLLETLKRLRFENSVDLSLRFDADMDFAAEFNGDLAQLIAGDSSSKTGLSPYTNAVMTKVITQVNDGNDIGGLGIADGRLFARTMLKRVCVEDPDVNIPTAELTELHGIELSDAGKHEPKCLPLTSMVLIKTVGGSFNACTIADLSIGDEIVVGIDVLGSPSTTTVIDVSHRIDNPTSEVAKFVHVEYACPRTRAVFAAIASSDHNLEFAIYGNLEYKVKKATFGKLKQAIDTGNHVAIRNGAGEWMPVAGVRLVTEEGYAAPITASGTIVVVPKQHHIAAAESLEASKVVSLLTTSAYLSTYSTVPDSVGKAVNIVKRSLFGPSGNVDGAGTGFIYDSFSSVGEIIGSAMGHTIGTMIDYTTLHHTLKGVFLSHEK